MIKLWLAVVILGLGSKLFAEELLSNGGFELGSAGWTLSTNAFVSNSAAAHRGTNFLSIGTVQSANYQPVMDTNFVNFVVPAGTKRVFVSFYGNIFRTNGGTLENAGFALWLADGTGKFLMNICDGVFNDASNSDSFLGAYHLRSGEITAFETNTGGHLQLQMVVESAGSTTNDATRFNFDDFSVEAQTNVSAPANDNYANRAVLAGTNLTIGLIDSGAAWEAGETSAASTNAHGGASVWWSYTPATNGMVTLSTRGSSFNTLLGVYTGDSVSNLSPVASAYDTQANHPGASLQFNAWQGTNYSIVVDGTNGATGFVVLNLALSTDTNCPSLAITNPVGRTLQLTNTSVTVQGTAGDSFHLSGVGCRVESKFGTNAYQAASTTNGWTNWSVTLDGLFPGTNTIRALAWDENSNTTTVASTKVVCTLKGGLTLSTSGQGKVSPASYSNAVLLLAKDYTVQATAAKGWVFSNWVDGNGVELTNNSRLTFAMSSNLTLRANFVPNPFPAVKGTYTGLFIPTNTDDVAFSTAGSLSATIGANGALSAKLLLGGATYSLSGSLLAGGTYSTAIARKGNSALMIRLALSSGGSNVLSGGVSSDSWEAPLWADRLIYSKTNRAPQTGNNYTMAIQGPTNVAVSAAPGDFSTGAMSVNYQGAISFGGTLSDGTKVTRSSFLSLQNRWPLYFPLYSGKGAMLGWITVSNQPDTNQVGILSWFKPASKDKIYPAFDLNGSLQAFLSSYTYHKGSNILEWSRGMMVLEDGNLSLPLTNLVALSNSIATGTNKGMSLTFSSANGLFSGKVPRPANGKASSIAIHGGVLQNQNAGFGSFLGSNQTGSVLLLPQ